MANLELKDLLAKMSNDGDNASSSSEPVSILSDDSEDVGIFTKLGEAMEDIHKEGNDHLIYSAMISEEGIKKLEMTMITHNNNQKFVTVMEETAGFSAEELETLSTIISVSNVGSFQSDLDYKFDNKYIKAQEIKRRQTNLQIEARNIEITMNKKKQWLDFHSEDFHHSKLLLEKPNLILRDVSTLVRRDPKAYNDEYLTVKFEVEGYKKKLKMLTREIRILEVEHLKKEKEVVESYREKSNKAGELILENTGKQLENISKIKEIELKKDLESKGVDFYSFVRCECGVCTSYDITKLPRVITGDAFGDLESRVYQDNSIKVIAGVGSDGVAYNTKFRLRPDPNRYRRILLPGISDESEPMVCSGCNKKMIPPIEVIESMLDYGWVTDTNSFCASKVNSKSSESYIGSEKGYLYCGSVEWGSLYNPDLFVKEVTTLAEVNEDFRKVDVKRSTIHHLTDDERLLIAKIMMKNGETIDSLDQAKEDFYRSKTSLRTTIKKLTYTFREINTDLISADDPNYETKIMNAKVKNKNRKALRKLIDSQAFLNFCLVNNISSLSLTSVVKDTESFIKEHQELINEFSLDLLFDSVIAVKLQYNGEWYLSTDNLDTSHYRFVLTYKEELKQLMSSAVTESKLNITTKINQFKESMRKYKPEEESTVREVESKIRDLKLLMEDIIGDRDEEILMKFVSAYGSSSLPYENGKVPAWLKNQLTILGIPNEYEVEFPSIYSKLYAPEQSLAE